MNHTDRIEALENLLEHFDECATLIRALDDRQLTAYDLATFEGQGAGWLGEFARDRVQAKLDAAIDEQVELDDHGPGCDGPLNCTCQPTHDEVMASRFEDATTDEQAMTHERAHAGVSDPDTCDRGPSCPLFASRCPSCCVSMSEPPTSDDCPIADEHASAFKPGERIQFVDPTRCRLGRVVYATSPRHVIVAFDDDQTTEVVTDGNLVRENARTEGRWCWAASGPSGPRASSSPAGIAPAAPRRQPVCSACAPTWAPPSPRPSA